MWRCWKSELGTREREGKEGLREKIERGRDLELGKGGGERGKVRRNYER